VAWLLGIHLGMGAAGGWLGLAGEIIVGASLFWLRVWSGKWRSAADLARRNMVGARRDAPQDDVTTEVAPVELDDDDDDAAIEAVA